MLINCNYSSKTFPFIFVFLFLLLYFNESQIENNPRSTTQLISTSVWCHTTKYGNKKCVFNNLCYTKKAEFLFVLTEKSIISGLKNRRDFGKIKISSVANHSKFLLSVSLIPSSHNILEKITLVHDNIFAISRFKPDNIMHVIHDDLLPLYNTYKELCFGNVKACKNRYKIMFLDNHEMGPFISWYRAFSYSEPYYLSELYTGNTVCFSKFNVGVDEETVVFQYGFKLPQGPVISDVAPGLLRGFREYFLQHFQINELNYFHSNTYTLFSRKLTRKILNEDYIESLLKTYSHNSSNVCILKVDVSINSTNEILQAISSSELLLGMHGAGMILSIFLPGGSTVLELFPFAIRKEFVSPLYALSHTHGIHFKYLSWTNYNESNSVEHPEYPVLLGGITHLSKNQQKEIRETNVVPPVKCCHNPLYLYKMFQDTIIDESILPTIQQALTYKNKNLYVDELIKQWYFPGYVNDFKIFFLDKHLSVSWTPPINVLSNNIKYSITVLTPLRNISMIVTTTHIMLELGDSVNYCEAWISCIVDDVEGFDSYAKCIN